MKPAERVLASLPGTVTQVSDRAGIRRDAVRALLDKLYEAKHIRRTFIKATRHGFVYQYYMAPPPLVKAPVGIQTNWVGGLPSCYTIQRLPVHQ